MSEELQKINKNRKILYKKVIKSFKFTHKPKVINQTVLGI